MSTFLIILIAIASIFLVFIVVIQNSKGGGLAASFSSSNQVMGVRKTTDFLEKATWVLAGVLVFLCVLTTITMGTGRTKPNEQIDTGAVQTTEQPPVDIAPFESSEVAAPQETPQTTPPAE